MKFYLLVSIVGRTNKDINSKFEIKEMFLFVAVLNYNANYDVQMKKISYKQYESHSPKRLFSWSFGLKSSLTLCFVSILKLKKLAINILTLNHFFSSFGDFQCYVSLIFFIRFVNCFDTLTYHIRIFVSVSLISISEILRHFKGFFLLVVCFENLIIKPESVLCCLVYTA